MNKKYNSVVKKEKIILILISTLISFLLGYLAYFTLYYKKFDEKLKRGGALVPKEKYEIILKYLDIVNHIRPEYVNTSELVYSVINPLSSKKNILMQGDSWFAQINFPARDNAKGYHEVDIIEPTRNDLKSLNFISNWAKKRDIGVINAGTGSYSPSLMSVQIEILERDFNIFPNILVTYIDQTDFGDEVCRYSKNKIYENGKLSRVSAIKGLDKPAFNYTRIMKLSEINFNYNSKFMKVLNSANFEIYWEFKKFYSINSSRLKNIFKNNEVKKCTLGQILSYLKNPTEAEINYFKTSVFEYLDRVKSKTNIEQIYLVTFPHLDQLKYLFNEDNPKSINISNIIDEIVEESNNNSIKKIKHINFSKIIRENKEMFHFNDYLFDKIHLKQNPHKKFISEIFEQIVY